MMLKGKHIFIVEDNLTNRVVFQMSLVVEGAKVDFERWGRDTISQLQSYSQIDLIILDLMLPNGVSGYDIFTEIRTHREFDHIPIVAVSATESAVAIPKTQEMGFSGFIAKPIHESLFPRQLVQILNKEKIWYYSPIGPVSP
jgi:CheY-like chemotaxis protein